MTKEQFRENILKTADHDFEECKRIFEETGNCLWCNGDRTVPCDIYDEDSHQYQPTGTENCPVCNVNHEEEGELTDER